MPYITQERRDALDPTLEPLLEMIQGRDAGDLTYVLYRLAKRWAECPQPSYTRYNAARGSLMDAHAELYRRRVAIYEDQKIEENGDIPF